MVAHMWLCREEGYKRVGFISRVTSSVCVSTYTYQAPWLGSVSPWQEQVMPWACGSSDMDVFQV